MAARDLLGFPKEDKPVDKMSSVITDLLRRAEDQRKEKKRKKNDDGMKQGKKTKQQNDDEEEEESNPMATDAVHKCHFAPDPSLWEYERRLKKLATKGVVQLFNAVNKQQKEIETKLESVGTSERKRQKVLKSVDKGKFLDMLKGKSPKSAGKEGNKEPSWSVLRDSYGLKDALKDDE